MRLRPLQLRQFCLRDAAKRLLILAATDPERERALRQALLAVPQASRTLLSALQWWLTPAPTWPLWIKSAAS